MVISLADVDVHTLAFILPLVQNEGQKFPKKSIVIFGVKIKE